MTTLPLHTVPQWGDPLFGQRIHEFAAYSEDIDSMLRWSMQASFAHWLPENVLLLQCIQSIHGTLHGLVVSQASSALVHQPQHSLQICHLHCNMKEM